MPMNGNEYKILRNPLCFYAQRILEENYSFVKRAREKHDKRKKSKLKQEIEAEFFNKYNAASSVR